MTEYIYRLVVVATAGNTNAINNHMKRLYGDAGLEVMGKDIGLHSNPNSKNASRYWFSTVYREKDLTAWKDLVKDFGSVDVWTWHMYGTNEKLIEAWAGSNNVTVGKVTPLNVLSNLGLHAVKE